MHTSFETASMCVCFLPSFSSDKLSFCPVHKLKSHFLLTSVTSPGLLFNQARTPLLHQVTLYPCGPLLLIRLHPHPHF